jgi:hypothetical protein
MSFAYRQVTISGHRIGTEGTSKAINEIVDVMVNGMGWVLEDDRRAQAGTASITTTHKVALRSNLGESGDQPEWHVVITSGNAAAAPSDLLGFQISTAYDTAAHDVPGTGIETPADHTTMTLATDSDAQFILWISGSKDGVVLVTHTPASTQWVTFGRSQHFLGNDLEPYGLYLHGATGDSTSAASTAVRSIAGQPAEAFTNANEGEFLTYSLAATNQPQYNLGESEAIWTALPVIHSVDDQSPVRKGAIGICSNFWAAAAQAAGLLRPVEVVVSGTSETYLIFGATADSLVIRKS